MCAWRYLIFPPKIFFWNGAVTVRLALPYPDSACNGRPQHKVPERRAPDSSGPRPAALRAHTMAGIRAPGGIDDLTRKLGAGAAGRNLLQCPRSCLRNDRPLRMTNTDGC